MINFENFKSEFVRTYLEAKEKLPAEIWVDLARYFPERYGKMDKTTITRSDTSVQAGEEYLDILKSYLIYYRIPVIMETIVAAFDWGIGNLRKYGLYNAPNEVKHLIALMRHSLQPHADMMETELKD